MTPLVLATWLLVAAEPVEQATVLVVVGASGAPDYEEPLAQSAERWKAVAEKAGAKCLRVGDGTGEEPPCQQSLISHAG